MTKAHRVPIGLPIAVVVLVILGAISGPLIQAVATERQANNVLLAAIPFVCFFAAIVLSFITLIAFIASRLNHTISAQVYRVIELTIISGIVLGVIGMFQPWWFSGYRMGFFVLLISTLAFILWSHIVPRGVHHREAISSVSISEFEKSESGG